MSVCRGSSLGENWVLIWVLGLQRWVLVLGRSWSSLEELGVLVRCWFAGEEMVWSGFMG